MREEATVDLGRAAEGLAGVGLSLALAAAASAEGVDASAHWPHPPAELERRLAHDPFRIVSAMGGIGGVMGVKKLQVEFVPGGEELAVKWKKAPKGDADGWNNTPRKELAAYEMQKWFLDPADYVVPTIVPRCIPPEVYAPLDPHPESNLPGTRCVMGALVVWIDNVTVPEQLFEPERFTSDPLYARHMANFNLLTYLIEHEDGRRGNFLVSELEDQRRVFSIDNGVAFGALVKNFGVANWDEIRVPALRKQSVDRLRQVDDEQIEALGVLVEMHADRAGVLRPVEPTRNTAPHKGARVEPGRIQLGLEDDEIEAVQKRIERLLEDVDSGKIAVF